MQSLEVVFTGLDQVELRRESVRQPGPGEVLVRADKTLISTGTECIYLGRLFEPGSDWERDCVYPWPPGYSMVGRVVTVGPDVLDVREGERVAVRQPHQHYVVSPVADLYRVPDGVSDDEAAWFGMATIAQNGVRRAEHQLGEAVVVIGLGLLGQLVVQYLRLLGARDVIAIDLAEPRLEMARAHGATATLAMGVEQAYEEVLRATAGAGADVVYDVTGVAAVFPAALQLVRRFGRVLLLGASGGSSTIRTHDVLWKGIRIIGAHDAHPPQVSTDHAYWSNQQMGRLFFTFLQRREMRVADLITHRYSPLDAAEAYRLLRADRSAAMGVLFDWTQLC